MIIKKIPDEAKGSDSLKLTRRLKTFKGKFFVVFLVSFFLLAISVNPLNRVKNSVWADQPISIVNLDQVITPKSNTMVLSENGVAMPVVSPLFVSEENYASLMQFETDTGDIDSVDGSIIKYAVQKGETLSQIAEKFNISVETILLSNELSSSKIKEGQELMILPINGLIHMVEKGETLVSIAKDYGASADQIAEFNNLNTNKDIYLGDVLIIPNGKRASEPEKPVSGKNVASKPKVEYTDEEVSPITDFNSQISSAYFIVPTKGVITQGSHYSYTANGRNYYTAVDIGGDYGTPIVAAAGGTVQIVKSAWPYGMYITISHENGSITLYSHLSSFAEGIISGAKVSQGQIIGYMGNTGNVVRFKGGTGTHLHFEVRGATNPLAGLPVGRKISY
jgi:murein DD-endopeptidase MepM/ murein hydrolase activator NlpD